MKNMERVLIQNGTIIDGTGGDRYQGNILIDNGVVHLCDMVPDQVDARIIDAAGKFVTPGFIDMHSHGDLNAAIFPEMESFLAQGITTVVTGHCGLGVTPIDRYWMNMFAESDAMDCVVSPFIGGARPGQAQLVETELFRRAYKKAYDVDLDWTSWGEYVEHLKTTGIGVNMVGLVGHGNIRIQTMGLDYKRIATEKEIETMKRYVAAAMEEGAWGLSFGLDYSPGIYANTHELIELAKCVQQYHGIVTAHIQHTPERMGTIIPNHTVLNGVKELLEVGLASSVHVHVSHIEDGYHGMLPDDRLSTAGAHAVLELIEEYRKKGVHVTWDVLPSHRYAIFHYPYLVYKVLPYAEQCGSLKKFREMLGLGSYKQDLATDIKEGRHVSFSPFTRVDPTQNAGWSEKLRIVQCTVGDYVGKTLLELAQENGKDSVDMMLDILQQDIYACAVTDKPSMTPELNVFINSPDAAIGLDSNTGSYRYVKQKGDFPPVYVGGTTEYCGAVKFLQDCKEIPMEKLISKMSGNGARMLRLKNRGLLKEGYSADVVILDPSTLDSRENFVDPRQMPEGIEFVFVNGKIVREKNKLYDLRQGKILEMRADRI